MSTQACDERRATGSARLRIGVALAATACVLTIVACARAGPTEPTALPAASPPVQAELIALIRAENRILFDAIVSGDPSRYPTVYYNDPTVKMHPDYEYSLSLYGDEARATLATLSGGPIGAQDGYLTARIASLIYGDRNTAAWEAAIATAEAEGWQPSIDDLPEGFVPMERVTADRWIEPDYHLFDVRASADRGSAKVAFGPPEAGGQVLTYQFVRVGGRWYVSYSESTWSQGEPGYRGASVP